MLEFLNDAGYFAYPLGICSFVGICIIIERMYALRQAAIMPRILAHRIIEGGDLSENEESSLGRIVSYWRRHEADTSAVKTYARLEFTRMERGFVFLEIIVGAAPLLGLLGTVVGLIQVFHNVDPSSGLPDPASLTQGVALALTTTVLGLAIAIPCLIGISYLQRSVENYSAQMESLLEHLGVDRES